MSRKRRVQLILYRGSLFIVILLLIGFAAVTPIDSIAQATVSDNDAFNTFIVIGALVVFGVVCIIIIVGRMIYRESCLIDIPRRYLPITVADLPHKGSRDMLLQNMDRSKELTVLFKKPKDPVIHNGLEPPANCDLPDYEKLFPEYLNYESCLQTVASRIKYQGLFMSIMDLKLSLQDTFEDLITNQFIKGNNNKIQIEKARRYVDIYEFLQYSGKPIARELFIEFVELSIYFADILATTDKSGCRRINTSGPSDWVNSRQDNVVKGGNFQVPNTPLLNTLVSNESSTESDIARDEVSYFPESSYLVRNSSTGTVAKRYSTTRDTVAGSTVSLRKQNKTNQSDKINLSKVDTQASKVESFKSVIRRH
ncbi:Dlt1p KNAG_0E02220 [Huiozyma naganishii CBS 8797]|uniref:Defect at low temperature protein 1 n=1 Tax=Huiozyma naganishii (strain ATCC MYA-139 / BCRC 22969 / CBS 8797 / KCTC 17520 / NBRC 10181 / NCYC 3082 / Yp74L-3) TaxID=1071383 RepID=J7RLT1_HUIN7|nr:hypothetical protein KNAG_0E02220 [Kazachstania naganishii CBS 8797]CCK70483.1 hypothetical protein KNAG_0E02220 [Kazachstania naganishii CBS 8797]